MPIPAGPLAAPGYCTVADLRDQLGNNSAPLPDAQLEQSITAASRDIDNFCNRRFWLDNEPTTRVYPSCGYGDVLVHDIGSTTGLVLESSVDDEVSWSALTGGSYRLEPRNAGVDGVTPHAWWWVVRPRSVYSAPWGRDWTLRVTALHGWSAVPPEVTEACVLRATALYKRRDTPWGVGGGNEAGFFRIRQDGDVAALLAPFVRPEGIA